MCSPIAIMIATATSFFSPVPVRAPTLVLSPAPSFVPETVFVSVSVTDDFVRQIDDDDDDDT